MKKNESKAKMNATGKELQPQCPACLSGLEPTILTGEFADALRESL